MAFSTQTFHLDATPQNHEFSQLSHKRLAQQAEAFLAARGLLDVARGHTPPAVQCIIDVDMSLLPMLPESHTDWHARLEDRSEAQTQNDANQRIRFALRMQAWTDVYVALFDWSATDAPELNSMLWKLCCSEETNVPIGYFDGLRAWGLVWHWCSHGRSSWMEHWHAADGQRDRDGVGPTVVASYGMVPGGSSAPDSTRNSYSSLGAAQRNNLLGVVRQRDLDGVGPTSAIPPGTVPSGSSELDSTLVSLLSTVRRDGLLGTELDDDTQKGGGTPEAKGTNLVR
jgi:hypothetical protein